ncbi:MAG: O-antigen ligase family protein [Candidatus Omnitrophota bacterium]
MQRRNEEASSPLARLFLYAVYITLCFQLISTATYFNAYYTNPLINKLLLGQYLALSAWLFYLLHSLCAERLVLVWHPYYLPALGLLLWSGIRSFTAPNPGARLNFFIFAAILSSFPLWTACFRDRKFRRLFAWAAFMAGAFILAGCLRQLFTEKPAFSWKWFPALTLTPGSYERQRLGSFLGHNNPSSAYLWISVLYAILLWRRNRRWRWSAFFGVYIALALTIVFLGGSRGVVLMMPPGLAIVGLGFLRLYQGRFARRNDFWKAMSPKKWLGAGGGALGVLLILLVVLSQAPIGQKGIENVMYRFRQSKDDLLSGTYPRVWWISLLMAREHALEGVGFSSWPYLYPSYQESWFEKYPYTRLGLPKDGAYSQQAHNEYLQGWAELGLPGLALILWLLALHGWNIVKLLRSPSPPFGGLIAAAATVGTLMRALFGFPFHEAAASCLFLANLGYFAYYAGGREWEWRASWMSSSWMGVKGFALAGGLIVFSFLFHPIHRYIVGDMMRQLNTTYKHKAELDPSQRQYFYDQAHISLKDSIAYLSDDGEALYELGKSSYFHGMSKGDDNLLRAAIEQLDNSKRNYSFYDQYAYLGRAYRMLWEHQQRPEDWEKSLQNFRKSVAIYPLFYEGWVQIAVLLGKGGKPKESYEFAAETELRFPGFVEEGLLKGAYAASGDGDNITAGMLFDLALIVKPANPTIFLAAMNFYRSIDRLDMAARVLAGAGEHQAPELAMQDLTKTVWLLLQQRRVKEAYDLMAEMRHKVTLQSNVEAWFYSGLVSWHAGQPWESAGCWAMARRLGATEEQLSSCYPAVMSLIAIPACIR